jgi:hypothetical protein
MTMRQARSTVLLALAAAVAALAAGCGGSDNAAPTTDTQTTPAPSALRVGLITDLGQLNDDGFNELAYNGLKRAQRELGVKGRVVEAKSAADYVPNMTTLARQGYDLIVGVGFAQGNAVATALPSPSSTSTSRSSRASPPTWRGCSSGRSRSGISSATWGRFPRSGPEAARSAPSAVSRSLRSIASSRATELARRPPYPARR